MVLELAHAIAINLEMFMHDSIGEMGYSLLNEWMVCDYVCVVCVCSVYALYTWELCDGTRKKMMF